ASAHQALFALHPLPLHAALPIFGVRSRSIIEIDGLRFRDLDGDGQLAPYEDWRLSAQVRAADLVGRMTLAEKAGLMLIDTVNAGDRKSTRLNSSHVKTSYAVFGL